MNNLREIQEVELTLGCAGEGCVKVVPRVEGDGAAGRK